MRILFLCLILASMLSSAGAKDRPPNILILYLDDMGWGQPYCYGGTAAPTPHIDDLAQQGARFTNGYSTSCVCSPSRVGLMTGRYQARTGHDGLSVRPGSELLLSETLVSQRLKDAGYHTGIIGKWHLGATDTSFLPTARGFDVGFGSVSNLGEGKGPSFYRGIELIDEIEGAPITSPVYAAKAVEFINNADDRAWFLYVPFNAVHSPIVSSQKWLDQFKDKPKVEQQYCAYVAQADEAVGTIIDALDRKEIRDETLVFLTSDNGGAHRQADMGGLRGRKWLLYEGGIRVPFIVCWPGRIPASRVIDTPVIQTDIAVTSLSSAGIDISPDWQLDGVDLLPLLSGKVEDLAPRDLFFRFGVQYAVRSGDYKLVKAGQDLSPMLFDLRSDPAESHDLSQEDPSRKAQLQSTFDAWNATMQPPRWQDARWLDGNTKPKKKAARESRSSTQP